MESYGAKAGWTHWDFDEKSGSKITPFFEYASIWA